MIILLHYQHMLNFYIKIKAWRVIVCLKSSISDFYVKMLQFIRNKWFHDSREILTVVPVSASFNKTKQNPQKT